jgi:predicted GNAT family acetyltransferase
MSEITDNPARSRFEMVVDGEIAFVEYGHDGGHLVLKHTEVPRTLAGRGIGSILVRSVLEDIRHRGLTIVPECEFVAAFIQRHPEFADLVAKPGKTP